MNTQTSNPTNPPAAPCSCVPCDVPAFCRLNYYTGKLLTARDFSDEQRYHVDKHRLHNSALHGMGVVCGLKVKPHPYCPDLRIIVEPGLAIDACGREIRLLQEVELILPQPPPPSAQPPCPPEPEECLPRDSEQEPPVSDEQSWWVCLRYCERPEQFSLAPFDECACTGATQKPNRICESYCLELLDKEPACLKEIEEHKRCGCENCHDFYRSMLDECKVWDCDCIPLARIHHYTPGVKVEERMIDNWTHRPLLPSVHRLDQVVRCLLDRIPCHRLTRISDLNWTHGADLRCHEFFNRFVSHDRGFEIRFDGPVRREGINRRTFQATVVHHPSGPDQPLRTEIAPAHVDILSDTHIRLRIDEHYARRHLDQRNFDLFITLKCDVIVNHHGTPVDGDLLARVEQDNSTYVVDAPTGDGVPGGLFESWIRSHAGETRHD